MSTITIKARRVDGQLVGTDESSEWNIDVLAQERGIPMTCAGPKDVQRTRRALAREGFALTIVRG